MPMDSKTYITLDLQAPNVAVVAAGKQNDLASRKIVAQLRDGETLWTPPAGAAAMIRYAKPDSTAGFYDVLEDGTTPAWSVSGSTITITLCEQMLTVAGRVWVEINFYTSTAKLTTFYFLLEVQCSVLEDATIISSDYYNVLSAQIQALLGATTNPPQIDPVTKNWLLWDEDTGAYVDSGFSSVGTTGPQGPQGVGISTVTKASGTGAPGTTDVYNVNKTDGTVAGQFGVYNGADGQGSPGSATPLSDSGSGVVGTANAYSRQDHRHPLNVDSTDPAPLGTAAPGSAGTYARRDHVHKMPTASDVGALPSNAGTYESGTDGLWAYHKYSDGTYHAWYEGAVNLLAGTAFAGGYFHQTTSALTPPSFSTAVTSLSGSPNDAMLMAYVGHANDFSTYWFNGSATASNNQRVRLDMYGTW